jgi:hypothetical protein
MRSCERFSLAWLLLLLPSLQGRRLFLCNGAGVWKVRSEISQKTSDVREGTNYFLQTLLFALLSLNTFTSYIPVSLIFHTFPPNLIPSFPSFVFKHWGKLHAPRCAVCSKALVKSVFKLAHAGRYD